MIGFDREVYALMEPESGMKSREEMVCIVVSGSEVDSPLTVQPRWSDVTTTSK